MINLLPPNEKEILAQEKKLKMILILGIVFFVSLISLFLLLFLIKIYTQSLVDSQRILIELEEKQSKTAEIQNFREKVANLNKTLSKLSSFYQSQTNLTEILEKISGLLPTGMYLNSFSYQKATSQISLSGFAPNRETLSEFKKKIEEDGKFREIDFPVQNWVKQTDIDFYVTFKINPQ